MVEVAATLRRRPIVPPSRQRRGGARNCPGQLCFGPRSDRLHVCGRHLFVPNFAQPQLCWPLSTRGLHPTLFDGESRWCCCSTPGAGKGGDLVRDLRRRLLKTAVVCAPPDALG